MERKNIEKIIKRGKIVFDEKSNTYDSLEKLLFFLNQVKDDLNFWKWAIIALHSSLYGAMILALRGTNPLGVIKINKNLRKELKKLYGIQKVNASDLDQIGTIWIHGNLISFKEAFERIQNEKFMKMYEGSKIFKAEERHHKAIENLNDYLRNNFMHFKPQKYIIGVSGLRRVFQNSLNIIDFCLFKSGNISFDEEEKQKFQNVLKKIKSHKIFKKLLILSINLAKFVKK